MDSKALFRRMLEEGDLVTERLAAAALAAPDRLFIHYGEQDRRITYGEFARMADSVAAGLQALGAGADDRICVFSRNALVAAIAMFAIWRVGAIYCPINFLYKGRLLAHQLGDTRPAFALVDHGLAATFAEVADSAPEARIVLHVPGANDHDRCEAALPDALASRSPVSFQELMAVDHALLRPEPRRYSDIANIIYTSGTTGPAKGVVQPYRWMNQYCWQARQILNADDVLYCDLPMYHVGGAFFLIARACWVGASVALYDRFSPQRFWERVNRHHASCATLLDVMVPWLANAEPGAGERGHMLNKVHLQPLPLNHHAIATRFGFDFLTVGFGQTESGVSFLSLVDEAGSPSQASRPARGRSRDDILARARACGMEIVPGARKMPKGFIGRPSPLFDVAILDEEDLPCGDGQVGQLALRPRFPETMLRTYFNRPDAMAKASANYWYHTGDAAFRDSDGLYFFVDRMGGVFRVRGENVSSYQVEDLLSAHAKIRAVAALPVPAAVGDEEDCAVFVQLREGEAMDLDEFLDHARAVMPRYMVPRHVRFVETFPLTATNKVEKYKLREQLLVELRAAE